MKLFDNISDLSIIGGGMAKLEPNKKAIEKASAEDGYWGMGTIRSLMTMMQIALLTKRKGFKCYKNFSKRSIFPVDVGSLSPSYLLKSPSFDGKMMEINLK